VQKFPARITPVQSVINEKALFSCSGKLGNGIDSHHTIRAALRLRFSTAKPASRVILKPTQRIVPYLQRQRHASAILAVRFEHGGNHLNRRATIGGAA